MTDASIGSRLLWFAKRVRTDVFFADIGTDHAKLPVYLVKKGIIKKAIASDIGEGPIKHARAHIGINGCNDYIKTCVGDGISHLEIPTPADIAICGMGGETIIGILSASADIKKEGIRLLLQPMTDFALVRHYLSGNGFSIVDEDIVFSDGKMYQCMIAEYTSEISRLTDFEAELGKINIARREGTFIEYVKRRREILQKCHDGKKLSGADVSAEFDMLCKYDEILKGEI